MKRIAIIEDDKDYLEVLTKILEKEGFKVYGAATGFDIVKDIVDKKPDLIFLDLMLPGVDGDKVMGAFQKKDIIKDIPVIIISSKDESDIKKAAKQIKAAAYMKKPVDKKELVEMVKKQLGNK